MCAAQVALELGIRPELLYKWRARFKAAGEQAFPGKGRRSASDEEAWALRQELERVRMERDILKKALRVLAQP